MCITHLGGQTPLYISVKQKCCVERKIVISTHDNTAVQLAKKNYVLLSYTTLLLDPSVTK